MKSFLMLLKMLCKNIGNGGGLHFSRTPCISGSGVIFCKVNESPPFFVTVNLLSVFGYFRLSFSYSFFFRFLQLESS